MDLCFYMNTYILTEGKNLETFLKENYTIALESCYLFVKEMLRMKLNMILIVLMVFLYIRHSLILQQMKTLQLKYTMNLTVY